MEFINEMVDLFLHFDIYLGNLIEYFGSLIYVILFAFIFSETGVVVLSFLPGDSLIFASATFAGLGKLNIFLLWIIMLFAAILGDTCNYTIGRYFGNKLVKSGRFIKQKHIDKTNTFFEKYGGKTIIIARFIPVVRTLAPFVAGLGKMNYKSFLQYNVLGGFIWITLLSIVGYFFGTIDIVRENFSLMMVLIVFISISPAIFEFIRCKLAAQKLEKE